MTYVCGYSWKGTNFIICDTRLTVPTRNRNEPFLDIVVKSGELFPGCIYGRSGDVKNSLEFLKYARKRTEFIPNVSEKWDSFCDFVKDYPYPKNGRFSLIISSRITGKPVFYILDSIEGFSPCSEIMVSIGSGKTLLDPIVKQEINKFESFVNRSRDNSDTDFPPYISAYRICQNLTLSAKSIGSHEMTRVGVGGVFHFISQNKNIENRQRPSLYAVVTFNQINGNLFLWLYRILSVVGGLVVYYLTPPLQTSADDQTGQGSRHFYWDESLIPMDVLENNEMNEIGIILRDRSFEEIDNSEFYHYLGWGFSNPDFRNNIGFQIVDEGGKPLITSDADIQDILLDTLIEQIKSATNYEGVVSVYWANNNAIVRRFLI